MNETFGLNFHHGTLNADLQLSPAVAHLLQSVAKNGTLSILINLVRNERFS
jgi:hypothetical protein